MPLSSLPSPWANVSAGICFGPGSFVCSPTALATSIDIARDLPFDRTGGNTALAALRQVLQTNFLVPGGVGLLILLFIDLVANIMEVAVHTPTKAEKRAKAAIWVRCIDWATAATATVGLADYLSLVLSIPTLIRVAFIEQVNVKMGMVAIAIHVTGAAAALLGAVIKTFLASEELQLKPRMVRQPSNEKRSRQMPPRRPSPLGMEAFSPPAPYETKFNRGERMERIKSRFYGRG